MKSLLLYLSAIIALNGFIPETLLGQSSELRKRIAALSQLIESPKPDLNAFVDQHCSEKEKKSIKESLKTILPKLDDVGDVSVELSSASKGQFQLVLNNGTPYTLEFELTSKQPILFKSVKLKSADSGRARMKLTLEWEQLEKRLNDAAGEWFSGVIAVYRNGEPVLEKAYGMANRKTGIKNSVNTVFAIGSAPIEFTWVSILILKDRGKLSLDDPITKFFDKVPNDKRQITIRHLMTGKSGLPDFHDRPSDKNKDHSYIDRSEAVRRIFEQTLLFDPGSDEKHSHSAWGLLAAIVEIKSGMTFPEFTKKEIYEPLGMNDTGFFGDQQDSNRVAVGYGYQKSSVPNSPDRWGKTSWLVMGSGGQVSTIPDMVRWKLAMHEGKLLSKESHKNYMAAGDVLSSDGDMFGFEFMHSRDPKAMFLVISNAIDTREKRQKLEAIGRALFNLIRTKQLKSKYSIGFSLGVSQESGTVVRSLVEDGAASKAGLQVGDVLISANGKVLGSEPVVVLDPLLRKGEVIQFVIRRAGVEKTIKVKPEPK